jgi:hypothetical protein
VERGAGTRASILRIALTLVAFVTTGTVHAHMDTTARIEQGESFVPRPDRARVSALGFDSVVADYYWLMAVQAVGGSVGGHDLPVDHLGRLIDVVTTVDPWVDHAYRFAALWLTDDEESVRHANRLLLRGVAHHPTDWRNRYHLGFNHFFYLEENQRAADWLESAIPLKGSPRYLGPLVARLRLERGGLETAAAFLRELARSSDDEYARAEYEKSLDEIQVERAARFLDTARDEYGRRFGVDITRVEDLLAGPNPVLRVLPRAHPHLDGWAWVLNPESGEIVSSFYGSRYQLHEHPSDRARRARWKALRGENGGGEE